MSINVGRVVLSGLIAGAIELILKIAAGQLYLDALFREAIEPVNPAWMANVASAPGMIGFILITLLLGVGHMYIYAAMRPRFDGRLPAVFSAALGAGTVESLNWGIIGLIGIFTWWHICVEATITVGYMLIAVYTGSMVYKDAQPHCPVDDSQVAVTQGGTAVRIPQRLTNAGPASISVSASDTILC